jgi:PhoH-like ATPase
MAKKTYIFDTSVCLTDFNSIKSFGNNDIILPLKVLDEIDGHKTRQDGIGSNARQIIRYLDGYRANGNLLKGVRIEKGKGLISVKNCDPTLLPDDLDITSPDNQILATALTEQNNNPRRKVIVVSRDINMRVKCDALGLPAEDYNKNQVVKHTDEVYTGFTKYLIDDQIIDQFYGGEDVFVDEEEIQSFPNQYIMLVSNANEKKTALARFINYMKPLRKVRDNIEVWSVKPRNKEQNFAFNLLMDPSVSIVSLIGKAGSGKTLMAIASGLEQIIGEEKDTYRRLIVSRPIQPMGKDLGYLPGTLEEKMSPWLAPIQDNLEYLMGNNKATLEMYVSEGTIEIEALTYIRGRSISNAFIVIDEAQNLTRHEIKTILTRVGENTKIVLTGDIDQIDNTYIDETNNGLTYAIEKLKDFDITGHIALKKGERSKVATLAANIL